MTMEQLKLEIKGQLESAIDTREVYSQKLGKAHMDADEFAQNLAMFHYYDGKATAYKTMLEDMGE